MTTTAPQPQARSDGSATPPAPTGVVVGYDGSASAAPALQWAAAEAARRGTTLTVLYAADAYGGAAGAVSGVPALYDDAQKLASAVAREGVSALGPRPGLVVAPMGRVLTPLEALVEASRTADLLVVGNRGRGALAGAVMGSVAFSVTARAHCPVVVVRGDPLRCPDAEHPVVVGVDGSPCSEGAVRFAAAAAARAGAPLQLLAAWSAPQVVTSGATLAPYDPEMLASVRAGARSAVREATDVARATSPGLDIDASVVEAAPGRALGRASKEAGLVVVGARGHGCLSGLLLGSVSHATIHSASCPVAVVRWTR